ncbi:MAG: hypothetical protein FWF95_04200 [Syntrophorhabdaceae bacterium]|nr:hypothetical protein [Syntrophorhabdaceae bacterium]
MPETSLPSLEKNPDSVPPEEETRQCSTPVEPSETAGVVPPEEEMQRLRSLLLKSEIEKISDLERRLNDFATKAKEISDVLPEAILMRSGQDNVLNRALEPIVEHSFKASLKKNPNDFINAFFPLIGSTIRRSISESFNSMLNSFSKSLEYSFSLNGILWRLEALRTGKSFSEVVLLNTMVYRVNQIFLIHSETGLVLSHVVNEGVTSKDVDLVSGMLTAIQDFARDCFNNEDENSSLNSLKMDEYTIYIVRSPLAYIACMVEGTPPGDFLDRLHENLELILAECGGLLYDFNGDSAPFEAANKYLRDCLVQKFKDDQKPTSIWMKRMVVGAGVLILLLFFAQQYYFYRSNKAVDILLHEPGWLVINVTKYWGFRPWKIICFKDELARPPFQVFSENGYDSDIFNIQITRFVSYAPEIVKQRAIKRIMPPEEVKISFAEGTLFLSGIADMSWILDARQIALTTPGVNSVDVSGIHDPRAAELTNLIRSIETAVIRFQAGSDMPIPSDRPALDKAINDLVSLERMVSHMGLAVNLTIYGQADATGSDKRNYDISQLRARMIASRLFARQVNIPTAIYGIGADLTHGKTEERENPDRRKIDLRVHLVKVAEADYLLPLKKQEGNVDNNTTVSPNKQ